MTLYHGIGVLAAVALVAAIIGHTPKRSRQLALLSAVLFLIYGVVLGSVPLAVLSTILAVVTLIRLQRLRKARAPTRATWEMDDDVQNRIRDIQAESRYSSAGIEF